MVEQATTETFKTEHYEWVRYGEDAVVSLDGAQPRKWDSVNLGNGLLRGVASRWLIDPPWEPFDTECKLALRALVGPPPWEVPAATTPACEECDGTGQVHSRSDYGYDCPVCTKTPPGDITTSTIDKIGERLCALSNEAEHGFAELRAIAVRLVGERDGASKRLDAIETLVRSMSSMTGLDVPGLIDYAKKRLTALARFEDGLVAAVTATQEDPPHHLLKPLAAALQRLPGDAAGIVANALEEMPYLQRSEDERSKLINRAEIAEHERGRLKDELQRERATLTETLKHLKAVEAERDKWIADFRELNHRATRLQGECDEWERASGLINKMLEDERETNCEYRERMKSIEAAADAAERIADTGTRDDTIEAVAKTMDAIIGLSIAGVVIQCPHGEPMHDHGDGCPSCMPDHELAQDIAKDSVAEIRRGDQMHTASRQPIQAIICEVALKHIQKQSAARTEQAVRNRQGVARFAKERGRDPHEIAPPGADVSDEFWSRTADGILQHDETGRTREETVRKVSDLVWKLEGKSLNDAVDVTVDFTPKTNGEWITRHDCQLARLAAQAKMFADCLSVLTMRLDSLVGRIDALDGQPQPVVDPSAMNVWLKSVQDALAKLDAEASGFAESKARWTQRWAELDDRLRKLEEVKPIDSATLTRHISENLQEIITQSYELHMRGV